MYKRVLCISVARPRLDGMTIENNGIVSVVYGLSPHFSQLYILVWGLNNVESSHQDNVVQANLVYCNDFVNFGRNNA